MTGKLFAQAMLKFFAGVILVGALIFAPAGTLDYWNGWLLMGILFVPMFGAGLVMQLVYTLLRFEPRRLCHKGLGETLRILFERQEKEKMP